jgi:hypothetical protein
MLADEPLPWQNQCLLLTSKYRSPNCTYTLNIKGPKLDCNEIPAEETSVLSGTPDPNIMTIFGANFSSSTSDSFHIGWYPKTEVFCEDKDRKNCKVSNKREPKFLNCSAALVEYHASVTFKNTNRSLTYFTPKASQTIPGHVSLYLHFHPSEFLEPERDLPSSYELVQGLAIRDALFNSLKGRLSLREKDATFSEEGPRIVQSRFSSGKVTDDRSKLTTLTLNITKEGLQDLIRDVTFSLVDLERPNWKIEANVTERKWVNKYNFNSKPNIYVPYGLSLAATLAILLLGLVSLRSNGAPADDGFLQIVCFTRASKTLDDAAKRGCRGEDAHFSAELKELELVLGDIVQRNDGSGDEEEGLEERATVLTGFGTSNEVKSWKRRI